MPETNASVPDASSKAAARRWPPPGRSFGAALLALALAGCSLLPHGTHAAAAPSQQCAYDTAGHPVRGELLFADEFNAPNFWEATHRPQGLWRDNMGYGGLGDYKFNDELQVYAGPYFEDHAGDFDDGNHLYRNGTLSLVARKSSARKVLAWNQGGYSSGMISTRGLEPSSGGPTSQFSFRYGRIEGRIDPSEEQGAWNALWLLPSRGAKAGWAYAEIDVMEKIGQEQFVWQAVHGKRERGQYVKVPHTEGFHVYALDWTPSKLTWFIDGVQTWQIDTPPDMQQPMTIFANLAVGGSWAGKPDFGADGKTAMVIDWIRVYGPTGCCLRSSRSDRLCGSG